jgi:hypothetical protein
MRSLHKVERKRREEREREKKEKRRERRERREREREEREEREERGKNEERNLKNALLLQEKTKGKISFKTIHSIFIHPSSPQSLSPTTSCLKFQDLLLKGRDLQLGITEHADHHLSGSPTLEIA